MNAVITLIMLAQAPAKNELPKEWLGHWKGTLTIETGGDPQQANMEMKIARMENSPRYTWQIIYGSGEKQSIRNYELVPDEKQIGKFVIDEKNSIIIDAKLAGNVMVSAFEVTGVRIQARYELAGDELKFEIVSTGEAKDTGGEGRMPKVKSFPVSGYQSAVLKRQKP